MIEAIIIIAILSLLIYLAGKSGLVGKISTGIYTALLYFCYGICILVIIAAVIGTIIYFVGE